MARTLTTVTGTIEMPNGDMPASAQLLFSLTGWTKSDHVILVEGPQIVAVTANGNFSVDLQTTDDKPVNYTVEVIYAVPDLSKTFRHHLGVVSVPAAASITLGELLSVPAPVPSIPDALAQTIAAAGRAEAAQSGAAGSEDKAKKWAESSTAPGGTGTKSAKTWATESKQSATSSSSSKDAAAISAGSALDSKNAAAASAVLASDWAQKPVNSAVVSGKFSALHWAQKAAEFVAEAGSILFTSVQSLTNPQKALAQANIGLVPQNDRGDDTPGRVLLTGAYGLGNNPLVLNDADNCDNVKASGVYYHTAGSPPANTPRPGSGMLLVNRYGGNATWVLQRWYHRDISMMYTRVRPADSSWGPWVEVLLTSSQATTAAAQAGTDDTMWMSPLKTADAIKALSIGWGQTWQDVSAERLRNTTYQNTTPSPIEVAIIARSDHYLQCGDSPDTLLPLAFFSGDRNIPRNGSITVPPDHFYRLDGGGTGSFDRWAELR